MKRGKPWQMLPGVPITVDSSGAGEFTVKVRRASPKLRFRVYVTVDGVESNRIIIRKR